MDGRFADPENDEDRAGSQREQRHSPFASQLVDLHFHGVEEERQREAHHGHDLDHGMMWPEMQDVRPAERQAEAEKDDWQRQWRPLDDAGGECRHEQHDREQPHSEKEL